MRISGNLGRRASTGFTILELLVVLSITAILATVAVPSVRDSLRRNSKESGMLDFMSAISLARSEAVSQSRVVTICRSSDPTASTPICAAIATPPGDWSTGWVIFTDAGTAATVDGSDSVLKAGSASNTQSSIRLKDTGNDSVNTTKDFIQFDRDGSLKDPNASGVYFTFCDSSNNVTDARAILLNSTGRTSLSTDTDSDGTHNALTSTSELTCP